MLGAVDDLERVLRSIAWREDATSTRIERSPLGVAVFNEEFARYWDGNFLRVDRFADATLDALLDEVDRRFATFDHREIVVLDDEHGARLAAGFRDAGWEVGPLLLMTARRPSERASTVPIETWTFEQIRPLLVEGNLEAVDGMTREDAEMDAAIRRVFEERTGARFFVGLIDGRPAGYCELYVHDGVAELDNVHTLVRARGRGVASALVHHAVEEARAAGADLVFLIADDADWPKELYAKLGFDPLGRYWQFRRPPPGYRVG
jgi:ribosomal protein S18 acetylase RimI-like enzyme